MAEVVSGTAPPIAVEPLSSSVFVLIGDPCNLRSVSHEEPHLLVDTTECTRRRRASAHWYTCRRSREDDRGQGQPFGRASDHVRRRSFDNPSGRPPFSPSGVSVPRDSPREPTALFRTESWRRLDHRMSRSSLSRKPFVTKIKCSHILVAPCRFRYSGTQQISEV